MRGIVLALLEELVSDQHGEDVWDDVLATAEVDGADHFDEPVAVTPGRTIRTGVAACTLSCFILDGV